MLSLVSSSVSYAPLVAPTPTGATRSFAPTMETAGSIKELAKKLNPVVGYWDPLGIVDAAVDNGTEEATLGWFRHAEIKHGRVAMAAFVGFCVQSNGYVFPNAISGGSFAGPTVMYADIAAAGGPADQWDALPTWAKIQIIGAVGIFEAIGELSPVLEANGEKHYVKGGKPGYYPPFKGYFNKEFWPHPLPLDLFDPFGLTKKMTPERKEKALLAEINNGRLAMLGIMSLVAASSVEGSVPALAGKIAHYDGEVMAPWSASDTSVPLVAEMLKF